MPGILTGIGTLVGAIAAVLGVVIAVNKDDDRPPDPPAAADESDSGSTADGGDSTSLDDPAEPMPDEPASVSPSEVNLEDVDTTSSEIEALVNDCAAGDASACADLLDGLAVECNQGFGLSCDVLYQASPVGSEYEFYGATCGGRLADDSFAGQCASL